MFVAAVGFALAGGAGCGGGPEATVGGGLVGGLGGVGGRPALEPVESLIAVCPGSSVVIPVRLNGSLPSGGVVPLRFGEGPIVAGSVVWIGVRPGLGGDGTRPAPAPFATAWMGLPGEWTATPASGATRPASVGTWAIVAEVPAGLAGARTVRIGEWPMPLAVLPEGCLAGLFQLNVSTPRGVPADVVRAMRGSPWLARAIELQNRSPLNRWRGRLAWRLLDGGVAAGSTVAAWDAFEDPVIEAMARQAEWRWAAGLARLAGVEPELASAVAWRIGAVADLGGGVAMPVWPEENESMAALGEDLLNPLLGDAEVAGRARAWLSEQPGAAAWVVDDGGATDAVTGGLISTVAVTNLGVEPAVAFAAHERAPRAGELIPVGARTTARIAAVSPEGRAAATGRPAELRIEVGDASMTRPVLGAAARLAPPGLRIGPLLPDWSLAGWLAHGSSADGGAEIALPVHESWATGAMLYREPGKGAGGVSGRWVLYVECRRAEPEAAEDAGVLAPPPAGSEVVPGLGQVRRPGGGALLTPLSERAGGLDAGGLVSAEEELRVWLGPLGAPTALLRVTSDGYMVDELGGGVDSRGVGQRGRGERIEVRRDGDRWSCWIPVPERCVEGAGVLRLSLERTDARGVRTAWPRRMLPWQREPGRAAIDVGGWGGR